jgi:thioredoxin reductase
MIKINSTIEGHAGLLYDCIIIGAGPGGLQAAIYPGRYNRKTLIIDRGGERWHCGDYRHQIEIAGVAVIWSKPTACAQRLRACTQRL